MACFIVSSALTTSTSGCASKYATTLSWPQLAANMRAFLPLMSVPLTSGLGGTGFPRKLLREPLPPPFCIMFWKPSRSPDRAASSNPAMTLVVWRIPYFVPSILPSKYSPLLVHKLSHPSACSAETLARRRLVAPNSRILTRVPAARSRIAGESNDSPARNVTEDFTSCDPPISKSSATNVRATKGSPMRVFNEIQPRQSGMDTFTRLLSEEPMSTMRTVVPVGNSATTKLSKDSSSRTVTIAVVSIKSPGATTRSTSKALGLDAPKPKIEPLDLRAALEDALVLLPFVRKLEALLSMLGLLELRFGGS
mmetsp:Transcript_95272/g.174587  ORF Transcript_95272/g.174587 Transcript_95272/m.174587 type:complete len:309 (+) Transcript_95272:292-1218(+)